MSQSLRIVIVDDEPLARYACRKMLIERFSGYQVVGEAGTGPEALSICREKLPDIVMMDINIPDVNGLETSQLILQERPATKIIILSAHDNFEYVQKAMNTGILGYLLKPVQEEPLMNLLGKASRQIFLNAMLAREQKEYHIFRSLAVKDMVAAFIHGNYGGLTAESFAELMRPPVQEGRFIVAALDQDDLEPALTEEQKEESSHWIERLPGCYPGRWLGPILPVFAADAASPGLSNSLTNGSSTQTGSSLQTGSSTQTGSSLLHDLQAIVEEIARRVQASTGKKCRTVTGPHQSSPREFPLSFRQAFDQLHLHQDNQSVKASDIDAGLSAACEASWHYPEDIEEKLLSALTHARWTDARKAAQSFSTWLVTSGRSVADMHFIICELLIQIRRSRMLQKKPLMNSMIQTMMRVQILLASPEELRQWFDSAVDELIHLFDTSASQDDTHLQKILRYIDLNDFSSISLENAAELVGLTPQYISKLFKQKFSINFLDYVIQRRIESASKLLASTNLSVKDIAARSGYTDVGYFSKAFRKMTGLTPRQYRLQVR